MDMNCWAFGLGFFFFCFVGLDFIVWCCSGSSILLLSFVLVFFLIDLIVTHYILEEIISYSWQEE